MINKQLTGKYMEGSGSSLISVLSWHWPVGTEECHEKAIRIAGLRAEILTTDFADFESVVLTPLPQFEY
jgi:hypothetical protein